MTETLTGSARTRRRQFRRRLAAAGAALAVAGVCAIVPGGALPASNAEALPRSQPAAQAQGAVPAVMHRDLSKIEPQERKDRRARLTAMDVIDGYAFVWGSGADGASGNQWRAGRTEEQEYRNYAPALVDGLPQGAIVDMASGTYDFNAVDTSGCIWGWGRWGARNGTGQQVDGSRYWSTPPRQVKINSRWDEAGEPLCGIRELSATDVAGAGIHKDGTIWSWGEDDGGGPNPDDASPSKGHYAGAQRVVDLPSIDEDPTNRPVQIEGGFATFWVILANGDVWYFGGGDDGFLEDWERPLGDQPQTNSGVAPGRRRDQTQPIPDMRPSTSAANRRPVRAARSDALAPWFRRNNPEEYVVQVHSGIGFGAALLSTGRVLTWGQDEDTWAALGRPCEQSRTADRLACARTPGYVEFQNSAGVPISPRMVGLSCGYTATVVISEDGELWAWSMPAISYEGHQTLRGVTNQPVLMAKNVSHFQPGEGYILYWNRQGAIRGLGYNWGGAIGLHAGNYGYSGLYDETADRPVWFAKTRYMWCTYWDDQVWSDADFRNVDYDGDRSNGVQPPPNWALDTGPNPDVRYIDANSNGKRDPDEQIVFIGGAVTEYTSGEVILYQTWDKWPCEELNNPKNRLSYDHCTSEAIKIHQEGGRNPDGSFIRPCA